MPLGKKEIWITGTYKECDNTRCLAV